jgi:putative heme iron utilization protein
MKISDSIKVLSQKTEIVQFHCESNQMWINACFFFVFATLSLCTAFSIYASPKIRLSTCLDASKSEEIDKSVKTKNAPRHDIRTNSSSMVTIDPEEVKLQEILVEHQKNAPKLGWATDVRTLIENTHGFAVISTHSKSDPGYPGGSVVGFAPDADGQPVFTFSSLSPHAKDLLVDPRCSLTVAAKEFKSIADGRVNLMGKVHLVPSSERSLVRDIYLKRHPNALWVDFGDFNWFRMEVEKIRFIGGFGRIASVPPEDYRAAQPDPISAFGEQIAQHMNDDHSDATIAMIANQIPGLDVTEAIITSVDSLGMYVKVARTPRASDQSQKFKIRLPFTRPALDRKDVKNLIVEMSQAAKKPKSL